MSNKRLAYS